MALTIGQMITDARTLLQDTDATAYRNQDTDLINALNIGFLDGMRLRPDIYATLNYAVPEIDDTMLGETFPLEPMFYSAFVNYIVGRVGMQDDEYAVDGRAAAMLSLFSASLRGA